jgi:muconolactone delta-isomerase
VQHDKTAFTSTNYGQCFGPVRAARTAFDLRFLIGEPRAMTVYYFFGYGSLVNRGTHVYAPTQKLHVHGWRRLWRQVSDHPAALLSVVPDAHSAIDGLLAPVPNNDWAALDIREQGYHRLPLQPSALPQAQRTANIAIYSVPASRADAAPQTHPILLSYLDVVLKGYLHEFGQPGVDAFLNSTDGWDRPVLDDRATPRYPRHQRLDDRERAVVDAVLDQLDTDVITP